jgi:hypothetical protein
MGSCFSSVKYLSGGGTQVLKSAGVRSLLSQQASRMASSCTALAANQSRGCAERPRYMTASRTLTWTAAETVFPANFAARLADRNHNTLKKGCNV